MPMIDITQPIPAASGTTVSIIDRRNDLKDLIDEQKNKIKDKINTISTVDSGIARLDNTKAQFGQFTGYLDKKKFSGITRSTARDTFSLSVNDSPDALKYHKTLDKFVSGSIVREDRKMSVSQHSYKYHIGSSFSVRVGNKVSLTDIDNKSSISFGQTCSISMGNELSEKKVKKGSETKISASQSYSVKDYETSIERKTQYLIGYGSATGLGTRYYEDSGSYLNISGCLAEAGLDYMPLRGHFTTLQQILCFFYGDMVTYESLWRIFNIVHTVMRKKSAGMDLETYLASQNLNLLTVDNKVYNGGVELTHTEFKALNSHARMIIMRDENFRFIASGNNVEQHPPLMITNG